MISASDVSFPEEAFKGGMWEGVLTATSSISHTGETLGTVSYLRREKILSPEGKIIEIPIISGNSLRGRLRDIAANLWWHHTGRPQLPLAVANAIWSGGSLTRTSGELLTGKKLWEVENVCPVINIFGAAGGGRLIDGAFNISKVIPLCKETAHLFPPDTVNETVRTVSFWNLLQIEYYTHNNQTYSTVQDNAWQDTPNRKTTKNTPPAQMRYGVETFIPGTKFHLRAHITPGNPYGLSLLADTFREYDRHALLGGKTSIGHGNVTTHWTAQPEWFPHPRHPLFKLWKTATTAPLTQTQHEILARLQ